MEIQKKLYPLTYPQKGIWHLEKLHSNTSIGNIAATLKINSKLDYAALNTAFNLFIKANDAIRIRIRENDDGEPEQYVSDYEYRELPLFDFSSDIKELYDWDSKMTRTPIYKPDSDLFYFALIKINENSGGFFVKLHHLIGDAWTLVNLGNEIMSYYKAIISGEELTGNIKPSYIDYVISEQNYLNSERFLKDQDYWLDKFSTIPVLTTLKEKKYIFSSINATRKTFLLPAKLCKKIREHCIEYKTSIFSLFLGAMAIYINRIKGDNEIVFGTPILNRSNAKEKNTMGMFISTVPIRINVDDSLDYISFSENINQEWMSVLRHQKYPYLLLLNKLREKNPGLEKLYDIVISYQNAKFMKEDKNSQEGRWHQNGCQIESLSIHINDREDDGNIVVDYDYLSELFYAKEIEFLHDHVIRLLWHALDNPARKLSAIEMLSEREKKKILYDFNNTTMKYPGDKTFLDLFVEQANKAPEKICCINDDKQITYGQLNKKSNQLARFIREKGIQPDDIAGVLMHRTIDMLVAIIGVLKAGGAYLPIEYSLPSDRINLMLKDCNTKLLITDFDIEADIKVNCDVFKFNEENISSFDDSDVLHVCGPENLIYVIYTSGSTGIPKGVMVEHKNVMNLICSVSKTVNYENKTVLAKTSVSFDVFVLDSLLPLANGAKIILTNDSDQKNSYSINNLIIKHKANMIHSVPSRLKDMLAQDNSREAFMLLTDITTGGESLTNELLQKLKSVSNAKIYNVYGPTETTVYSTFCDVTNRESVNIGKPIGNTQAYILDKYMNLLPIGVPGELCISGDGLTRGYINSGELTKEKFVENPFDKTKKMYKTGDIVRWYPEGEIEFIGRTDTQVKIRGVRIELGEIEKEIRVVDGIEDAVVIDRQDESGNKYLCAYLVCNGDVSISNLKVILSKSLPKFLIPSYFIKIESIPLTSNGKINRELLPEVDKNSIAKQDYKEPETPTEKMLVSIWQDILKIDLISRDSSFYDLGGDSLNVVNLINRIHKTFNVDIPIDQINTMPTVMQMSAYIDSAVGYEYIQIPKAEEMDYYPLSPAQRRIFLSTAIGKNNVNYNTPFALSINGSIEPRQVESVIARLIERHDALRTSFHIVNGEPVQKINKNAIFSLSIHDYDGIDMDEYLRGLIKPFDLQNPPLLRVSFIRRKGSENILFIDTHHIICDGISMNIFIDEFISLFRGKTLDKPLINYIDYAVWKNNMVNGDDLQTQEKYWLDLYKNEINSSDLPFDYKRPDAPSYNGSRISFRIGKKLSGKIGRIKKSEGITPYMVFMAAYNILLSKYTDQDDIIVGTPTSGRNHPDIERIFGMFVNTIALRNNPEGRKTFEQFLYEVRDNILAAFQNQDYPFEELVGKLKIARKPNRHPLFDTMLAYRVEEKISGDVIISQYDFQSKISKFDIMFEIINKDGDFYFDIEYCTDLFKKETVRRLGNHFINILKTISDDIKIKISDIDVLSKNERNLILNKFNSTSKEYPKDKTIQQLFEEQAEQNPENIAIIFEDTKYTYRQLNESANQLAWYLRSNGICPSVTVGIMMKRSFKLIAAIIGVLKAGGCYLPIDPDYPEERIQYLLTDSNSSIILTETGLINLIDSGNKIINIDDNCLQSYGKNNLPCINKGSDPSYVIYTSGSTGNPKGVILKHSSLINLKTGFSEKVGLRAGRTSIAQATISFDMFTCELLIPLANGMTVVLTNEEQQRLPNLQAILYKKYNIDFLQTTPSRMEMILNSEWKHDILKNLKDIVLGGEVFSEEIYLKIRENTNANLYNGYGPSETTVCSIMKKVISIKNISIGKPISNTQVYILNKSMQPVPIGVNGELYIGGEGVGLGYINRKELTEAKFLVNPFTKKGVIYRTGDFAKWLPNGDIQYIGRNDRQVKLRGLRIELGEIENTLLSYQGIEKAVVLLNENDGKKYICAYMVCKNDILITDLRNFLSKKLPQYMIPSYFVKLDEFPLSPNGKVDTAALLKSKAVMQTNKEYVLPENNTEYLILNAWKEALKLDSMGIHDNFFEIGGDSLSVIQVHSKLFKYGWGLNVQDFYNYQTTKTLSDYINGMGKEVSDNKCNGFYLLNRDFHRFISAEKNGDSSKPSKNILLTGATGFLGLHILYQLLCEKDYNVYCIVRRENNEQARKDLLAMMELCFHDEYHKLPLQRLHVYCGDITKKNLNLSQNEYQEIGSKVGIVIHSAANTKHYGHYQDFFITNVKGTQNVAEFCIKNNTFLYHISTMSVFGDHIKYDYGVNSPFTEKHFYVGQNYKDNVYVRSKFEAERLIFKLKQYGLKASILRVGQLTGRFADGQCQANVGENAFYNRIKTMVKSKAIPESVLTMNMEFTPVDLCGYVINEIIKTGDNSGRIYHLYNHNTISVNSFIEILSGMDIRIQPLSDDRIQEFIDNTGNSSTLLIGLSDYINVGSKQDIQTNMFSSVESQILLKHLGFEWPKIEKTYINRLITFLQKIEFI